MFIGKKYIYLNNWNYCAGLNDMKDRFTEYIKLSIILNLIPILPKIYLTNFHTKKSNNLLIDYLEIPKFICNDFNNINKEEIFYWNVTHSFIPNDNLYRNYKTQIMDLKFNIDFLEKYKIIALEVIKKMEKPICVVHVRRGDYLNIHDSLNYTTSPENIINKLKKYKFETCYIKTNEPDLTFFDKLKNYNVKFFKDFDMLKQIYDSGDNYALYSIECCIRNLCDIKISTLNTKQAELCWLPNNDGNFFDDYLDEHKGYQ